MRPQFTIVKLLNVWACGYYPNVNVGFSTKKNHWASPRREIGNFESQMIHVFHQFLPDSDDPQLTSQLTQW